MTINITQCSAVCLPFPGNIKVQESFKEFLMNGNSCMNLSGDKYFNYSKSKERKKKKVLEEKRRILFSRVK